MIRDKSAAFWFLVSIRSTDRLGPKPMASFSSSYSLSTKKFQAKIRKKKQNNNRKEGQHHMLFSSRRLRCACSCVSKICFIFFLFFVLFSPSFSLLPLFNSNRLFLRFSLFYAAAVSYYTTERNFFSEIDSQRISIWAPLLEHTRTRAPKMVA